MVYRVCYETATKKIIEMQSGGDTPAHLQTLIDNAVRVGWSPAAFTCVYMNDAQWTAAQAADPVMSAAVNAQKVSQAARDSDMLTYLPSWSQVAASVNAITTLADAKAYLLKLSRVVYWLAKNSQT